VDGVDGALRCVARHEAHEAAAARRARLAVDEERGLAQLPEGREEVAQARLGQLPRQLADEELRVVRHGRPARRQRPRRYGMAAACASLALEEAATAVAAAARGGRHALKFKR